MNGLKEILIDRKNWVEQHFYIDPQEVESKGDTIIVIRKNYMGVVSMRNNDILLDTIYDEIGYVTSLLIKVRVGRFWGFYDLKEKVWTLFPLCDIFTVYNFYHTIDVSIEGKHGLIYIPTRKLIIPVQYDDVTINAYCDYLWVKENEVYNFYKKSTGKKINLPGATFAYDNESSMLVRLNDSIRCMNERGEVDNKKFRQIMRKSRGRLKVVNNKYHILHIIDIYGIIINGV